ncbi:hypothetical protein L7F22_068693 [Adiantum nelumboides]|nr:hypothetical protein [Adiantum nelumboides]
MSSSLQTIPLFSIWLAFGLFFNLLGFRKRLSVFTTMCVRRKHKVQSLAEEEGDVAAVASLLDLPELAVETILSKLPPQSLVRATSLCKELNEKCGCDHLWLQHVEAKWGSVVGDMAFKEWQSSCSSGMRGQVNPCKSDEPLPLDKPLISWPLSCIWTPWAKSPPSYLFEKEFSSQSVYMKWYSTLETGAFWFPAQVFNRESGHVGFLLSCYDAELCYDRQTDTFKARYPPHGSCSPLLEDGVSWRRLRKPPTSTTAHELFLSASLTDLRPGDHVEVQWRRNKKFPYGWWYGVVGHLETCDKDSRHCRCYLDDMVWLEFNQYAPGSRWRRTAIYRKTHTEKGDDAEGFYAGVRKLSPQEASAWTQLWPKEPLE